jgi:hypothetical protein
MKLGNSLPLARCPHCNIAHPSLDYVSAVDTESNAKENHRRWMTYRCATCGGVTMAVASFLNVRNHILDDISDIWPSPQTVHESIPERAKAYLEQAIASIAAPSGAVMLTASAVDAMLKAKGLKDGSLNVRINSAAQNHLITPEMAAWAHEIRLDANDQRHDDEAGALPSAADAKKSIEFATALAQFLFVLPARVERGRAK